MNQPTLLRRTLSASLLRGGANTEASDAMRCQLGRKSVRGDPRLFSQNPDAPDAPDAPYVTNKY